MSVFRGSIIECPGIIVDHFTPSNCQRGRAYFLSHCHRDHMTGLDSNELLFALGSKHTHLYCSEVTKGLLKGDTRYAKLIPYMQSLPVDKQVSISLLPLPPVEKAMTVTVTLLQAGHCPGSVMFLFQWEDNTVLYTGDFRLSVDELKAMPHIHNPINDSPIRIDTLYLDTTFCHNQASSIISREKTREYIIESVEKWLTTNPSNVIYLDCPSFGYEHIFLALSAHFKTKIHISKWRMNSYSVLPEVQQCLTLNGDETRLHSCGSYRKTRCRKGVTGLPCDCHMTNTDTPPNVLKIKPSTQWFVTSPGRLEHPRVFIKPLNTVRVLHSMHSSYTELHDFVSYLQPTSVVPCVIPYSMGDKSILDLHDRIRKLLPVKSCDPKSIKVAMVADEEMVTVKRKDPICQVDDDDNENGCGQSDYETDDEYAFDDDHMISHDKSSDYSFDLSFPGFSNEVIAHNDRKHKQPSIELSFDNDESFSSQNHIMDEPFVLEYIEDTTSEASSPQPKRRRTESSDSTHFKIDHTLSNNPTHSTDDIQSPNSQSSSNRALSPDHSHSLDHNHSPIKASSPISIIDLTQTSSSDEYNSEPSTPDSSVIFAGTSFLSTPNSVSSRTSCSPIRIVNSITPPNSSPSDSCLSTTPE